MSSFSDELRTLKSTEEIEKEPYQGSLERSVTTHCIKIKNNIRQLAKDGIFNSEGGRKRIEGYQRIMYPYTVINRKTVMTKSFGIFSFICGTNLSYEEEINLTDEAYDVTKRIAEILQKDGIVINGPFIVMKWYEQTKYMNEYDWSDSRNPSVLYFEDIYNQGPIYRIENKQNTDHYACAAIHYEIVLDI